MSNIKESEQPAPLTELRGVKQALRSMMNGVTSHTMRQMGLDYKVNFGVEQPRLQDFAAEIQEAHDSPQSLYSMALQLWNEPIRECRLLAAMLMPPTEIDEQTAELWGSTLKYPEEAECTALFLYQYVPFAADLAFRWIASEGEMLRLCGWNLAGRLFMAGLEPSQRDADELMDQICAELSDSSTPLLRQAAYKTLLKYMELSHTASVRGEEILTKMGL